MKLTGEAEAGLQAKIKAELGEMEDEIELGIGPFKVGVDVTVEP